jgi:hypothetical protein
MQTSLVLQNTNKITYVEEKDDTVFNRLTVTEINLAERDTALCCYADRYKSQRNFLGQYE